MHSAVSSHVFMHVCTLTCVTASRCVCTHQAGAAIHPAPPELHQGIADVGQGAWLHMLHIGLPQFTFKEYDTQFVEFLHAAPHFSIDPSLIFPWS